MGLSAFSKAESVRGARWRLINRIRQVTTHNCSARSTWSRGGRLGGAHLSAAADTAAAMTAAAAAALLHSSTFFLSRPRSCTFSRNDLCAVRILADSTSFLSSSMSRLSLARRFWNHVITCALLRPSCAAISSRSAGDRYFWYRNRFSSSKIWWLVKAVRDLRFFFVFCCRELNRFKWLACASENKLSKKFNISVYKKLQNICAP